MLIRPPPSAVARLLLCPLAALLMAASPPEKGEKPGCDQIPICRRIKAAGLESQQGGQLEKAREQLQSAYELSQDYRLQAPLGRVLQKLGRGDEAFTAFSLFLQASTYGDPQREVVETWLREVIEESPPEESESPVVAAPVRGLLPTATQAEVATRGDGAATKYGRERPLCIAGATLAAVGIAGLIPSVVLFTMDTPRDVARDFHQMNLQPVWHTFQGSVTGMALSSLSLVAGAVMIGVSYRLATRKGSPCRL